MKYIELTQGKRAIVDDEDYDWLNQWNWCASETKPEIYIAYRKRRVGSGAWKGLRMHRLIKSPPLDMLVDHKNHDTLDNRKCNLRVCSVSQNNANRRPSIGKSSKYKGVRWSGHRNKWYAEIKTHSKGIHIGQFETPEQAAVAYDKQAIELFGEFAYTNAEHFPELKSEEALSAS